MIFNEIGDIDKEDFKDIIFIILLFFKLSDMKINLVFFDRFDKIFENVDFVWFL